MSVNGVSRPFVPSQGAARKAEAEVNPEKAPRTLAGHTFKIGQNRYGLDQLGDMAKSVNLAPGQSFTFSIQPSEANKYRVVGGPGIEIREQAATSRAVPNSVSMQTDKRITVTLKADAKPGTNTEVRLERKEGWLGGWEPSGGFGVNVKR